MPQIRKFPLNIALVLSVIATLASGTAYASSTVIVNDGLEISELLVVIDDIWPEDSAGVQTLLSALPPDADRVLTTRNEDFAALLGARVYNLDKLSEALGGFGSIK